MAHGFDDDLEAAVLLLAGNSEVIRGIPCARNIAHVLVIDVDYSEVVEKDPQLVVSLLAQHCLVNHDALMVHSHCIVLEESKLLHVFGCWQVRKEGSLQGEVQLWNSDSRDRRRNGSSNCRQLLHLPSDLMIFLGG